jgi:hypothetical protein
VNWFGGGVNSGELDKLGKLPGGLRRPIPENPASPVGGESRPMPVVPGRPDLIAPEVVVVTPPAVEVIAPGATIPPAGMGDDVAPAGAAGLAKGAPVGLVLLTWACAETQ